MKKISVLICLLWCFVACKKEGLMGYEGGNSIYMYIPGYWAFQSDTSIIDFTKSRVQQDTSLPLRFAIVGQMASVDRPFKLLISDSSTAVVNRDYVLPPADSFYIPADSIQTTRHLRIKRSPDLKGKTVTLILKLGSNEHFAANLPVNTSPVGNDPRSVTRLRVTIIQ
ncbi:DUF4843 domain-containing protein [Chitinophaga qingshengii]|uniref:DUF4843 domain-containing protein n=1 Tax=Chitinophaga qingshengii TaxID=1569794 RepID=A0ABR7THT4_9BACT|nr:DUF4843 domain-containing protein [Chitinophaga qingshengii]MBC9930004.1 DUF4843 domain-containing protein [Chitinophaga qingshengii]